MHLIRMKLTLNATLDLRTLSTKSTTSKNSNRSNCPMISKAHFESTRRKEPIGWRSCESMDCPEFLQTTWVSVKLFKPLPSCSAIIKALTARVKDAHHRLWWHPHLLCITG